MAMSEWTQQFAPLGYTRLRIVSCLGGDMPSLPQYLQLGASANVFQAFQRFVDRMVQTCADAQDSATRALIGAARLMSGELAGAGEILEHLPATAAKLDHGAGYCLVVPAQALQAALPLPASLRQAPSVLAGSSEQAALRGWLEQQESCLVWEEIRGEYRIANAETPSGAQP
jgi:hypothetical protein